MSFGFGVGDFLAVYDKCKYIYECLRNGPAQTRELAKRFNSFKDVVDNLSNITKAEHEDMLRAQDTAAFEAMQKRLTTISKDAKETLDEIKKFIKSYGGDGTWQKIRVAMNIEEIPGLEKKLTLNYFDIIEFETSLAARLGVTTSIDIHHVLQEVGFVKQISLATLYLITKTLPTDDTNVSDSAANHNEEVIKKEVENALLKRGIPRSFTEAYKNEIMRFIAESKYGRNAKRPRGTTATLRKRILVVNDHRDYLGVMFETFLKQTIDNEMTERYDDVVSVVTLYSWFRSTGRDAAKISKPLRKYDEISFREDLYIDRRDYHIDPAFYDIVMLIHPNSAIQAWCKSNCLGHYYTLEQFSRSHPAWNRDYRSPLPRNWFEGQKAAYEKSKDEITHGIRDFVVKILECTPRNSKPGS